MKKWENPEFKNLSVNDTNEEPSTYDYPHIWKCSSCGAHYRGVLTGGTAPFEKCGQCGACDWVITFCPPESGAWTED